MFSKIVVVLDGSQQAEKALPCAVELANLCNSRMVLAEAVSNYRQINLYLPAGQSDQPKFESVADYEENNRETDFMANTLQSPEHTDTGQLFTFYSDTTSLTKTRNYLQQIRALITNPAASPYIAAERVEVLANPGHLTKLVKQLTDENEATLVVMAIPVLAGIRQWAKNRLIHKLLKNPLVPLLLVTANPNKCEQINIVKSNQSENPNLVDNEHRIVVTLDGTSESEAILPAAINLAETLKATLFLLRVIKPASNSFETVEAQEQAYIYLNNLEDRLAQQIPPKMKLVKAVRVNRNASSGISDFVQQVEPDVLALATHHRKLLEQLINKSTLSNLIQETKLETRPAFLVVACSNNAHSKSLTEEQEQQPELTTEQAKA